MSNYTILVIDYEPKSIERVRRPLLDVGYSVEVATDGLAGLDMFHRVKPDLVMIEAMIPKKHGFEVCQEIKKTPYGKRTPVIITTSVYKGRKYRSQAFHLHGCDEYIEKPIDEAQIVAVCRRMLGDTQPEVAIQEIPTPADDADLIVTQPVDAPVSGSFSLAGGGMDEDELEIMARLDSILPGASPLASPAEDQPPVAAPGTGSFDSPFDPLPLEEGTQSVPIAVERLETEQAPFDDRDDEGEDHVVSFEPGRSRKRAQQTPTATGVGRRQSAAALAASATDVLEEKPPATQAVARIDPIPQLKPLETLKPVFAKSEPAVVYEPEAQARPSWFSVAVALALLGAAGALVYLYLGGMFGH